ncbi:hypothetical protein C8J57DRAFT_1532465 [Mycena rebaudengoi]|nr:hypothetical protein C8J57DRAFT_1532465 [Mycena rebaudengoi]
MGPNDTINLLVNFRAFETQLILYFFSTAEAECYHLYLWPDIKANTTGNEISQALCDATEDYMQVQLTLLDWCHIISAFLHWHKDPTTLLLSQDENYDMAQNHSTGTSNRRYGVDHSTLTNTDPWIVVGCINASRKWQLLTGLEGDKPLSLVVDSAPAHIPLPEDAVPSGNNNTNTEEIVQALAGLLCTKFTLGEQIKMYNEHLVTVVVLPLSGLHHDLRQNAFNTAVSLIYVSVKHAIWDEFRDKRSVVGLVCSRRGELPLTAKHYREPMAKLVKALSELMGINDWDIIQMPSA